ncbi:MULTISPECIES: hypothetical protein [Streptomyces]|uniref:Secreted protein n=1 Tax=Streptomyces glycanivorans TaxID=3033808 RepID=A0ABY9JFR0_9ACTN|nr:MULTISPECIES: hypothetical protein [unclassified Streptomyces]WSQ78214.1 hypothetical protein OG725_14325 [Streptomyces sp. NBC_01213]TXS17453.1 hypothetical protein EAO68_06590 [Streptomyces sp. wa22]WLQ64831.1 hypothetical protein P8A20_15045 [Streptomyces sp. Alt3]WSQ85586.1 hypothetical protein OG722_14995 [Streptomyces sp. NBC_01212]WSR08323.1 hypothetical protein OG265_21020 [Streptomyces sp. NBC_01208]
MVRRRMRFAAVLVVVVLALTGFSTSSHGGKSGKSGKSRSSGSSGGGCSSSKKSNNGYRDYDDDDDYDSSSSSSGGSTYESATPGATASEAPGLRVVRCAQPKKGKRKANTSSSIEVSSTATGTHVYEVDVTFVDAKGLTVDTGETDVEVDGGESRIVAVRMDSPRSVSRVKRCLVTAELRY